MPVSEERQNVSGNLAILLGIGRPGKFSGKYGTVNSMGYCRKENNYDIFTEMSQAMTGIFALNLGLTQLIRKLISVKRTSYLRG